MITYEIKNKAEPPGGAGAKDPPAHAGPAAAVPAEAAAKTRPRILVVDDELGQFVYAQLRESEPEIEALLGDVDAPEVEKLLGLCARKMDVAAFQAEPKAFQKFLMSDAFVQEVLLTDWFRGAAGADVLDKFSNFLTRVDRGKSLRQEFDVAFPSQDFQVDYKATRPSRAEALAYDFIFLALLKNEWVTWHAG